MSKTSADKMVREVGPNLFAEFDIPGAAEKHAKVQLILIINALLKKKGLTQKQAAQLMKCTQPEVSALKNCKLNKFSLERLLEYLFSLGQDVEITIRKSRSRKVHRRGVKVVTAA